MLRISRFAPSPTGPLHLGHAFSAVRAHDLARETGGRFLLRIEDIDGTRSRAEFIAGIEEDMRWLGLRWDGAIMRQSGRMPFYVKALERLRALGLVYPCFCTRAEIAASASAPHGDEGSVYPGTCRPLSAGERARRMDDPHCWRLDMARAVATATPSPLVGEGRGEGAAVLDAQLSPSSVSPSPKPVQPRYRPPDDPQNGCTPTRGEGLLWHDATVGWVDADPLPQGDVVLARKETPTSYHLAVTIDDAAQGVTDVVRGVDLFAATHVHRLLQALLGLQTPLYHHHPLLIGADGKRLAKRNGARALAELRAKGCDPDILLASLRAGQVPIGAGVADA